MADLEEEILPLNVTESIADEDSVTGKILYYAFPFRRQWQNEDYGKWQAALEFTCLLLSALFGFCAAYGIDFNRRCSVLVYVYMFLVWVPIVLLFAGEILLMQGVGDNADSTSTQHGLKVATMMMLPIVLVTAVGSTPMAYYTGTYALRSA